MNYAGVAIGLPGHRGSIVLPTDSGRASGVDALSELSAAARVGSAATQAHPGTSQGARPGEDARPERMELRTIPARHDTDRRPGAPSAAYLTQHIAQEVTPDDPGFDRYQAGARAYIFRRDSTVEILTSSGRLDVFV